jgi:hypothetical protein
MRGYRCSKSTSNLTHVRIDETCIEFNLKKRVDEGKLGIKKELDSEKKIKEILLR